MQNKQSKNLLKTNNKQKNVFVGIFFFSYFFLFDIIRVVKLFLEGKLLYVLAQIFFGLNIVAFALTWLQKKKSNMLLLYMLADILFCLHYVCLEKYSATIFVANEALFLLVIYLLQYHGNPKFIPLAVAVTVALDVVACVFTWVDAWTLFPLFATTLAMIGLSIRNIVPSKIVTFVAVTLTMIYLFIIQSIFSACVEAAMVCVAFCGIILSIKHQKKQKETEIEASTKTKNKNIKNEGKI